MKLRKTKTLCMFNQHDSCVGNINANLYDRGRHQDVYFMSLEASHNVFFFCWLHPAVQQSEPRLRKNFVLELLCAFRCCQKVTFFGLFNKRVNNICLVALANLLA